MMRHYAIIVIGRSVGIHENIPGGLLRYCAEVRSASNATAALATISEPSNYNRLQDNLKCSIKH